MASLRTAIVTGGASGLGRATATLLAQTGKFNVLVADLKCAEAFRTDLPVHFAATDVTNEMEVTAALDAAKQRFGTEVSVAVCCAGVGFAKKTLSSRSGPHDMHAFLRVLTVNAGGTFNVLRLAAERMAHLPPDADGQRGVVISTASIAAFEGQEGQAAYAASKGAVAAMTLPCARDLASIGVRVCTIAPGLFRTPLLAALPERVQQQLGASVPNPSRLGKPEEFAQLALAIIDNPMLNGEVIRLDGALRMPPK